MPHVTDREHEILSRFAQGQVAKVIADKMGIEKVTVDRDMRLLKGRFRAKTTPHMVYIAAKAGII